LVGRIFALDLEVSLVVLLDEPASASDGLTLGVCEGPLGSEDDDDDDGGGGTPLLSVAHCGSDPRTLGAGVLLLGVRDVDRGGALPLLSSGSRCGSD
jgi:hypothetical protein